MPLILRRTDVEELLSMPDAIELARQSFLALSRGQADMPQRVATNVPDRSGAHLSMPCYVKTLEREILAIKVVTVFPRNAEHGRPATMGSLLLHDPATGELIAIMDAEALTAIRTGAASALAADVLAPPGPQTLGLIGAGGQAASQVEGMINVRDVRSVLIHALNPAQAAALAETLQTRHGVECRVVSSAEEIARECRLIVCATTSVEPVLKGAWLRQGTHIGAIGAFRPNMAELDVESVGRARVFVDRLEAARAGAGDLIQAEAAGKLNWNDVTELGDLLANPALFQRDLADITLFKSVGLAVQDAFAADWVYRQAVEQGRGAQIELE